MTERVFHSLSAIQLSPHNVLLVAFGGRRSFRGDKLSDTVLVELSEYNYEHVMLNCSTVSSYSVTHCTVVLVYYIYSSSLHAVQGGDSQWVVGRVGQALEDKREYQQMLSEGRRRRRVEGSSDQLHEVSSL